LESWQHRRDYIGATENLQRRTAEHKRGSNHTTRRFGSQIELVMAKEIPSMLKHANYSRLSNEKRTRDLQSQY
jgi:predicted GIY-YIG superfamily endonuclease